MHVFIMFLEKWKTCFYVFFYLQINVFNISGKKRYSKYRTLPFTFSIEIDVHCRSDSTYGLNFFLKNMPVYCRHITRPSVRHSLQLRNLMFFQLLTLPIFVILNLLTRNIIRFWPILLYSFKSFFVLFGLY